jgi:lipoprotein signal peptidase
VKLVPFFVLVLDLVLQTVFRFEKIGFENRGVSFGIGQSAGEYITLVTVILVFLGVYVYRFRLKDRRDKWALLLILLGGVGNLGCRLIWGSVWDYICLSFLPFCFNLSDILICTGVVSYILGVNGYRSTLRGQRDTGNK